MVTLLLNLEQRSRSKRNKWRGPPSAAREGSSPFMPDCFLSVAEGSADRLRLPHSSNDTNRLAILDSDGPNFCYLLTSESFLCKLSRSPIYFVVMFFVVIQYCLFRFVYRATSFLR